MRDASDERVLERAVLPASRGVVGWVVELLERYRSQREGKTRQLELVEALALGGKRQLLLVRCGDEEFLVGGGVESVHVIVRVKGERCE